jgi:hypothetical protein
VPNRPNARLKLPGSQTIQHLMKWSVFNPLGALVTYVLRHTFTVLVIEVPYRRKYYVHFHVFSMLGFIIFPIDSDVSITSVRHLDYSKIYLHYISPDGSTWTTVVFGWLRHVWNWTFMKMAGHVITGAKFKWQKQKHTETLLGFFIYVLWVDVGGEGVWGDDESWGRGVGSDRIWERPRCHSSFAYSCLGNYLSKYIWFIGVISNSFAIIASNLKEG